MISKERIVVAMSGGVDSSVAAALLVEGGYDVVGMTMRLIDEGECSGSSPRCCSPKDMKDARMVASQIGIASYVIDLRKEFKKICDYFYSSYLHGETPNPCIYCNSELKFGMLLKKAIEIGAAKIATGHYARIGYSQSDGRYRLKRAVDATKDQAYFLFNLRQEQLSRIIFPLGGMTKREVRKKAQAWKLKVAEKTESQDICFSSQGDYRSLYEAKGEEKDGDIIDSSGKVLGKHGGIHNFTIGQRRGIGIARGVPLYVLHLDPARNRVVVGEEKELLRDTMNIGSANWMAWVRPPEEFRALVKIRSTHAGEHGTIRASSEATLRVHFDRPVKGVAAGQAAVFYDGDDILGGGWIKELS